MKRLFLSLAAIAALVSCVKENNIAPEQTNDALVTIKAVSADTKTLLDGTNVVWEDADQIKVVLASGEQQDFTASEVNGAKAEFTGVFEDSVEGDKAYAVYPSTAVTNAAISFSLAAEQTGVIESGMNLSFAELDVEELAAGIATATFRNALALVKVIVPEGIKSVSLTSSRDALVGNATFFTPQNGTMIINSVPTGHTVSMSNAEGLKETSYLLVYPGNAETLSLKMVALDGTTYTSTANYIKFTASEYRTINLTKLFKMETEEEMFIEPAGGECPVKITTTEDYTYSVEITDNVDDWLSVTLPVKSLHQEEIVFSAEENQTGADRTANVTITWGEDQTRSFKVTQKSIYMDFVNDENGDPIQWEESFGVYATKDDAVAGSNAKATFKNVFTISLSDDYTKGAYKITNMFKTDNVFPLGADTGGNYYADFEDGVLTVYMAAAEKSYFFTSDIKLTYDAVNKTFAASEPIEFDANAQSSYYNKAGFIGGYSVAVKVEEEPEDPETPGDSEDPYVGTWNITYEYGGSAGGSWEPKEGTMVIDLVDEAYVITTFADVALNWTLTKTDNVFTYTDMGAGLTLTYDEEKAQFTTPTNATVWNYSSPMFCFRNLVATQSGGQMMLFQLLKEPGTRL